MAYESAEASGTSFSVLDYISKNYPDMDLNLIKNTYFERAILLKDRLLEPGAIELLDFLLTTSRNFCIMSYGDKGWQNLKILSAGLGDLPRLIVSSHKKGLLIANWFDKSSCQYIVPKECFSDNNPRIAREIVLVDDKVDAFDGLPDSARGYLVMSSANRVRSIEELLSCVKCVNRIDEIISFETQSSAK